MTHDDSTTQGRGTARCWSLIGGAVVCPRCHPPAPSTLAAVREDVAMEKTLETKEGDR